MLLASVLLIGFAPVVVRATSVAIIGAGAGGSSAAYWIYRGKQRSPYANTPLTIDVYEKNNYVGGRSTVVYPYGDTTLAPIEQGAAIFTDGNKNLMRAVSEFGLQTYELNGVTPGIGVWDGNQFLYRQTGDSAVDNNAMAARYGSGPYTSYVLIQDFLNKFDKSYDPTFSSFQSVSAYAAGLGYNPLVNLTLQSYLDNNGVNSLWTREFETGSTRFNYAQDASTIQAVPGMASLSAGSSHSVVGGNYQVFQHFLASSGANVHLDTQVTQVAKVNGKYVVTTSTGAQSTYDAVVLAAPAALSGITFVGMAQQPASPPVNYVHLHATLIATTTPAVLPAYFSNAAVPPQMPGTIITTSASGTQPPILAFRYESQIQRNGQTEYIVRTYSLAPISDATITQWFGAGTVGWVDRKEWDAYPIFPVPPSYPPVLPDDGLCYVNSMEGLWSTMETEIISSRNCVDVVAKNKLGFGICGPNGPQGPKTDDYVLGWDC